MSQKNVETVRGVYEEWAKGNLRDGVGLLDPHVVLVLRPDFPDAGTYLGVEGVRGYTRHLLMPWTGLTITAEELMEAGDTVVVAVHQRAVGEESGIPVELRYFMLWTFRGGLVVRLESVRDRADALAAAGLSG